MTPIARRGAPLGASLLAARPSVRLALCQPWRPIQAMRIIAPARPGAAAEAISRAMQDRQARPEVQARWAGMGGMPLTGLPERVAAFVAAEIAEWGVVIRREELQMEIV